MFAVYQGERRLTKEPMTQYEAEMKVTMLKDLFSNLSFREIVPEIERPKPKKKRNGRKNMCFG